MEYLKPLDKSDHIVITFNINCYIQQNSREHFTYCYDKGDYEAMRKELRSIDWTEWTTGKKKQHQWAMAIYQKTVDKNIQKHIPRRKVKARNGKGKVKLDKKTLIIIRKKTQGLAKIQRKVNSQMKTSYRHITDSARKL